MEKKLETVMDELIARPRRSRMCLCRPPRLCLGVTGKASDDSAGIIHAIAEEAARLEPKSSHL
ncbi:unnamed protein product [Acanthoscelides obtectus]|uniref:Uncharacterized protein n=1 Tax=Acanthoscelides obtectus TaxID=200917 RepID=A0A9P0QDG6_ACAOB|nr:unnamed protein product [Acanthoscelides obtectus]CAK1687243.1 hypothetical protein AOBTE_LOCUS36221 [Acanthoscelides obtectus]